MRPSLRRAGPSTALLALLLLLAAPRPAGADDFEAIAKTVREELKSDKPATRLHAFALAGRTGDVRAVDLLVTATNDASARRAQVAKAQTDAQTSLEDVLGKIEKANTAPAATPQEIEKYNKRMRKYQAQRDTIYASQGTLALDSMQAAAEIEAGVTALGALLKALKEPDASSAVERLAAVWWTKQAPEERGRFLGVIAAAPTIAAAKTQLRTISMDPAQAAFLRALALRGRGGPGDEEAVADLPSLLTLDAEQWPVMVAAIDSLRRMHRREAIPPLIEFLARKDVTKLRRDAWRALRSLTGQAHGPYDQPWRDWWKETQATFTMPSGPVDVASMEAAERGATFFGEPLASDRVVFVLDISKSMTEIAHPDAAGARGKERRIDVLRKEFAGAIDQVNEGGVFNLIVFGSGVVMFSATGVVPDKIAKERAKKWLSEAEPVGGTNIHDALEAAFRMATPKYPGERAPYDTIVFLTDGTPTSGKLQQPDQILAAVAEWNAAHVLALRVFGIGECDEDFLKRLAEQNRGTFNKR